VTHLDIIYPTGRISRGAVADTFETKLRQYDPFQYVARQLELDEVSARLECHDES
jgi:hypothetical protein